MADWTANSDFGALGRREPVFRTAREPAAPREEDIRAERFAATRAYEEEPPRSASAALAEYNAAQDGPLAKARFAVWVGGGIVSLALIAGIGVWGYKLVLREVIGLPVVHAEQGPMRLLPADPGGEVVPQQGLAVNAIPAAGTAAPPSDVLMLAPPTPGLAEEDMEVVQTMAEADEVMPAAPAAVATDTLPPAQAAAPAEAVASSAAPAPAAAPGTAPDAASAAAQIASALLSTDRPMTTEEILAFADQISAQSAPLTLPAAPAQPVAVPAEPAAPASAPAVEIAAAAPVAASASVAPTPLRPQPRPAAEPAASAPAAPAEEAPAAQPAASSGAALTASLPAGTNLIQLGAFDSPEIAASEWTRLQGRFGEFLGSKERVIQETQSGGRTLFRLRALGFADRADARRLCAALTAEGADCIPVTVD